MLKRAAAGAAAVAALWEASVAYRRSRPPEQEEFRVGTTDDLLMDNLKAGDLVFFTRHWTTEHLPFMVLHELYRKAHDSEADHCGLLVQDRLGRLHVLERSYAGVKLRPFPARVNWSKARLILVRPRTDELPVEQRRALWQYATDKCAAEGSDWSYFWKQMAYVLARLVAGDKAAKGRACQDSLLVKEALRAATSSSSTTSTTRTSSSVAASDGYAFGNVKALLEERSDEYADAAIPIRTS